MSALPVETKHTSPRAAGRRELSLVPAPSPADRARNLMMQAKAASLEHLDALEASIAQTQQLAQAVVDGGDLYGPGVHEFSRRLAEDLIWTSKNLESLVERQRKASVSK